MVLSYYIYKYPYIVLWKISNYFKEGKLYFYCADPLDYEMFIPIKKYLPEVIIAAKNRKSRDYLKQKNIPFERMPVFPKAVIMARHAHYKFPVKKIIKIGFDHGLYQFKRWTAPENYNSFDVYFVSSEEQVRIAKSKNINTTKAIGYPKLDNAFNGTYHMDYLKELKKKCGIDSNKKTIIFTSTWNVGGLSALDRWIDQVHLLKDEFNILLTVHTWTSTKQKNKLREIKGTIYLEDFDVTPYLLIADIFVGDYNSLIGEFCSLNKPMITFKVSESNRSIPEITEMIKKISIQINKFDEIHNAISQCLDHPRALEKNRIAANKILFYKLDGLAGERAADEIKKLVE